MEATLHGSAHVNIGPIIMFREKKEEGRKTKTKGNFRLDSNCSGFICGGVYGPCIYSMYFWWSLSTLCIPTRTPGESYRGRLRSLLFVCMMSFVVEFMDLVGALIL